jgi:glutamate-1-semialdehyde 2,1-aminomutase
VGSRMRSVAIVQARMGSQRFPGKVMALIDGVPLIDILLQRLEQARELDAIVVATTKSAADDVLTKHLIARGQLVFRGHERDVLARYYEAAVAHESDVVVRITGDCPLVDPMLVDQVAVSFRHHNVDYASNVIEPTYPDGLDVEVFSFAALETAHRQASEPFDREHVTPYIRRSGSTVSVVNDFDASSGRWTVDELGDADSVREVFASFAPDRLFSWREAWAKQEPNPTDLRNRNSLKRNEGATMNSGQKLWRHATAVIPGGNMLLSKRPEMFAPDQWPAYFSKAKGCHVWDLDGNRYTDVSLMGIGTNVLGYGNERVDQAVVDMLRMGNMSTLNCPEEVELVDQLVGIHEWADMGRLARTGGEACAVAVRIARSATGAEDVAVCGYHGWHDWYLAANLQDEGDPLAAHLLPGLNAKGVPKELQRTVTPFRYGDLEGLREWLETVRAAAIVMEVSRSTTPDQHFLREVRELADRHNAVLVFDECTSGFRQTFGGLHKETGVNPDLAIFGKTLGNGYAITAVIGRREVMQAAQETFISSTFWTERIGPTAALAALAEMQATTSWEVITSVGRQVRDGWAALASRHSVDITIAGLPALSTYSFTQEPLLYKTLLSQEMLSKGYLATTAFYASIAHTDKIVDDYLNALDDVFALISRCLSGELSAGALLKGPICHAGLTRLN